MRSETQFDHHRGVVPMLWVFASLVTVELLVVHLLVSLKWPAVAWILSATTAASLIWLVSWILSFSSRPHELLADRLRLHFGSLKTLDVPLDRIAQIHGDWPAGAHKAAGVRLFVPLAHPNRMVELVPPLEGKRGPVSRVALRVDDPEAFDRAMAERGIAIA